MKGIITSLAAIAALAIGAAPAGAAVRTASATFNPNDPTPSFNPPPQQPLVTVTTSYNDVGTVSVNISGAYNEGGDVSLNGAAQAAVEWGYYQEDCNYSSATPCWGADLMLSGVGGYLPPTYIANSDGSETVTFTNPYLANQDYRFLRFSMNSSSGGHLATLYFPGYEPTVTVANPGAQAAQVGEPVSLQMSASEQGVSSADYRGSGLTSITGVNLPPGLSMDRTGHITGTPTQAGTGTTTVTATGTYNGGTQSTSASTTFAWTVTNPPPPAPVISTWIAAPQTVAQLTRMANAHHVIGFSARTERLRPVRVTNAGRKNGIDKWAWGLITPKGARSARVGSKGILFKHQHGQWRVVAGGGVPTHCPSSVFGAFEPRD